MSQDPRTLVVLFFWCFSKDVLERACLCSPNVLSCRVKEQAGMSKYCIFLQVWSQYSLEQAPLSVPAWVDFSILL